MNWKGAAEPIWNITIIGNQGKQTLENWPVSENIKFVRTVKIIDGQPM